MVGNESGTGTGPPSIEIPVLQGRFVTMVKTDDPDVFWDREKLAELAGLRGPFYTAVPDVTFPDLPEFLEEAKAADCQEPRRRVPLPEEVEKLIVDGICNKNDEPCPLCKGAAEIQPDVQDRGRAQRMLLAYRRESLRPNPNKQRMERLKLEVDGISPGVCLLCAGTGNKGYGLASKWWTQLGARASRLGWAQVSVDSDQLWLVKQV